MTMFPDIAVIVLNFNSADYTLRCVNSVIKQTVHVSKYSIVVVDNDSAPSDRQRLASLPTSNVRLVQAVRNLGFSGGMMLGVEHTAAEYYFFLNNDCELQNDVLSILYAFMSSNVDVALCSGSMFDADGNPRSSFNYFPSLSLMFFGSGLLRLFNPYHYPDRRKSYKQPVQVDVVTGAAMFIRGSTFKMLNGLDTGYFLYCEEEDFAARAKMAGWKTYHVPQARIMHIGGASSANPALRSALHQEYYISLFRYLRQIHGPLYAWLFRFPSVLKIIQRAIRGKASYRLAQFVLRGAPAKDSLRYKYLTNDR